MSKIYIMTAGAEADQQVRNAQALHQAKKALGDNYVFSPARRVQKLQVKPAVLSAVR